LGADVLALVASIIKDPQRFPMQPRKTFNYEVLRRRPQAFVRTSVPPPSPPRELLLDGNLRYR
jgi:hypothetical protein